MQERSSFVDEGVVDVTQMRRLIGCCRCCSSAAVGSRAGVKMGEAAHPLLICGASRLIPNLVNELRAVNAHGDSTLSHS